MKIRELCCHFILINLIFFINYQQSVAQGLPINPADEDPQRHVLIEPFRIVDNIYYVGATVNHSAYLLVSDAGHVLVDATYERLVPNIIQNIKKLGFNPRDIQVIVSNHAHPDHVEGLAEMREYTGATTVASALDAEVIESGGKLDFRVRQGDPWPWRPATIDRIIEDGEVIEVGDISLTAHITAGHTRGCTTWTTTAKEAGRQLDVVVMCAIRINTSMPLVNHPRYPTMPQDLAYSFARLKIMPVDIFLGPHGWIFGLQDKLERLKGNPAKNIFIDPLGFRNYVLGREREFLEIFREELY